MSGKTIAIIAGAGVGAFVLVSLLKPRTMAPPSKAKSNTDLVSLSGLIGIGSALGGLFGSNKSTGSTLDGSFDGGAYSDAASQNVLKNFDTSNFSVQDNFAFTDANGNFIAG